MIFWFDMDGVIVRYERWAYRGENPKFQVLGSHYYRTCKPDLKIIEVMKELNKIEKIGILTKVSKGKDIQKEQIEDKVWWLNKNCPFINVEKQLVVTTDNKGELPICKGNVLVDDYNDNLNDWFNGGGIPVKYLNGVNSYNSFKDGYMFDKDMKIEDIINYLLKLKR